MTEKNIYKKDFPFFSHHPRLAYLDNAATTQKPQTVIDAVTDFYIEKNANIHRGVYQLSQDATAAYEAARQTVKSFINAAKASEIVFTKGTTEGVNLVAATFGASVLKIDDEILISAMEHHANIVPWQELCKKTGAKLVVIPVFDNGEININAYRRQLSDKTKIVAITHASNSLGTINPIKKMIKLAHQKNAFVLIDGAQAVSHLGVDVQSLDCDFYVFSGHKLFAPTGIGVLYAKKRHLEAMPPYQTGGDMILSVSFEKTLFQKAPAKFEAGTPNISGAIGLKAAIDYLQAIDLDKARAHEQNLLQYATERLAATNGVSIVGRAKEKIPIVSFLFHEIHAHDIGTVLDKHHVAIRTGHHCTQPILNQLGVPATARISLSFYNTKKDIDQLIDGLTQAQKILR